MADDAATDLQSLTADIVSPYVSNNALSAEALSKLIVDTYQALSTAGTPEPVEPETPKPDRAAIRKSIHPDYFTCSWTADSTRACGGTSAPRV